jgi:hypothetical protein
VSHRADEELTGAYRVCSSCGHVYETAEDLVEEANLLLVMVALDDGGEPDRITDVAVVDTCPFCLHVFEEAS